MIIYTDGQDIMPNKPANLQEIVDALGFQMEGTFQYLNRTTGKVEMVTSEKLEAAKTGTLDDYPEWQLDNIKLAQQILKDEAGQFVELPSKFEIDEYEIMERFSY